MLHIFIRLKRRVTKMQAYEEKLNKMKARGNSGNHDSPVFELAGPIMFIAGLFALVALVSSLG